MFKFVHRALLGVLLLIRLSPAGSFEFCPLPGASLPWPENVGSSKHLQWRNISNHLTSNLDQIVYSALQINPNQTLNSTKSSSDALLSIEVTTRKGSVYTYNFGRTAALNGTGQGSQHDITNDSVFRIASVTKTFTAFEVLKRKLNLEASILEYLSGLETLNPEGIQNWDGVDVRSLGSALSGVSRDCKSDLPKAGSSL
jgi:Beta-lactamase